MGESGSEARRLSCPAKIQMMQPPAVLTELSALSMIAQAEFHPELVACDCEAGPVEVPIGPESGPVRLLLGFLFEQNTELVCGRDFPPEEVPVELVEPSE